MDAHQQVSQTAEFFRVSQQEQKERAEEHRAFRLGMAGIALALGAKSFFGRRGA